MTLLHQPLFHIRQHYITLLGLIAFVGFFAAGTIEDPEPAAFLEKFGDSTIDFELVAWSRQMSHSPRRFRSDLNYLIYKHLTAAGIEIPNPQRDLHIRSGTLKVENVTNN